LLGFGGGGKTGENQGALPVFSVQSSSSGTFSPLGCSSVVLARFRWGLWRLKYITLEASPFLAILDASNINILRLS
jgi:hypothetical protein